ncbi:MAG: hypothetical protein COA47_09430 [Robiginitomaculum sp.]|nr:MAG: hypothetical protein COA47_09430 [Robiginitomaculum sp.]
MEYKNILVPIDGGQPSRNALEHACLIAKATKAQLVLVHVLLSDTPVGALARLARENGFFEQVQEGLKSASTISTTPIVAGAPVVFEVVDTEFLKEFAKLLLQRSTEAAKALGVVDVETQVLDGVPQNEILEFAKDNKVDLIAMGSRGTSDIKSLFLGSVSHKLIENAECPCLVVK